MTNDSLRFLDPEVVAHISNLEVKARQIVEGLISGRHRSPYFGFSVEFAQHREYTPGDDLRHLDWKAWAKSDRLYVKQFEEETNLRTSLLVDVSNSMNYGKGDANKYEYVCRLSAALSYLLLRQSDSVGLVSFDNQIRQEVPHRNAYSHLRALLHALHIDAPAEKTDMEAVLLRIAEREVKRGMLVLISDLLATPDSVLKGLRLLRQRRHDLIVLHVLHDDELDFMFQGMTRFEGLETADQVTCDPRSLRDDYLSALNDYLKRLRRQTRSAGIDYRLIRTSQPIGPVLATLLHERAQS